LSRATELADKEEEERLLEARLKHKLRSIFHECVGKFVVHVVNLVINKYQSSLLTDPKSRKVLFVENPLLPLYVKEAMARILFNNLQVSEAHKSLD
jgi:actin-related protein 10